MLVCLLLVDVFTAKCHPAFCNDSMKNSALTHPHQKVSSIKSDIYFIQTVNIYADSLVCV